MQVYIVQAVYTDDERTKTKSILVVYGNEVSANKMAEKLRETFKSDLEVRKTFRQHSEAIKAEYSVQVFDVHD